MQTLDSAQASEIRAKHKAIAAPEFAWLVGLLALPWLLHAAVVLCSSVGVRPLATLPAWLLMLASLAGAFYLARFARRAAERGSRPPSAARTRKLSLQAEVLLSTLQVAAAIGVLYPLLTAPFLPIISYDAIGYRLPVIAQWLDAGRIAWVVSDDPVRNGYPLGCEAVSALIAAASGSLRFASTTSYLYIAPAAVSIVWLARLCEVRAVVARTAAALFLLVPMLMLNAASGYVDAAFASACICLFCTASLCVSGASPWLLFAAGMSTAHVLGLKGTGLPFVVLIVGLCFVRAIVQRRSPALRALAVFLGAAAPGLFWPLRNIVNTGNPLYPISVSIGGKEVLPGVGTAEQILGAAANTPKLLADHAPPVRVILTWLQWTGPALDFDYRLSGLGFAWPVLAVPAVFALLYRMWREPADRARYMPVAFVLLLTAACFALQPMAFWSRYTLWVWGVGALAIACVLERLLRLREARWPTLLILAATILLVSEAGYTLAHVHGLHLAVIRYSQLPAAERPSFFETLDIDHGLQAKKGWIAPEFWTLDLVHESRICRAEWKPNTDNANLDGVLAQLSPRPRVFIVPDDHVSWAETKQRWREVGCPSLLLFRGSPVLAAAQSDPEVNIQVTRAFDPLYLLRWRKSDR